MYCTKFRARDVENFLSFYKRVTHALLQPATRIWIRFHASQMGHYLFFFFNSRLYATWSMLQGLRLYLFVSVASSCLRCEAVAVDKFHLVESTG